MDLKNPTRTEALLANIAGHTDVPVPDMKNATRSERLLKEILDNGGGGGGDVTKEYVDTAIADAVADIDDDISALSDTVADKVDKVSGKGLSTNDYTDADKALVQDSPITVSATGSDLTLSTSSGNLNALTVYGKSEVVDGSIKNAGEGWSTVDLGTTGVWSVASETTNAFYHGFASHDIVAYSKVFTDRYQFVETSALTQFDKCITVQNRTIIIRDTSFTDVQAFSNSLNGLIMCYKKATPTGNAIAVKTDNGSGINGTMAVFTTGTPLRGIPDTDVRDVMTWNGLVGTVTKNCGEVDLGTLTWTYDNEFYTNAIAAIKEPKLNAKTILCYKYNTVPTATGSAQLVNKDIMLGRNQRIYIKDTDYTDATAFKNSLNGVKLIYELATPTTEQLTTTENDSIASLRTYSPQTVVTINDNPEFEVEAYANTANGQAISDMQPTRSPLLTLSASGWTNNTQTVTYEHNIGKRNTIDVELASIKAWTAAGILATAETASTITFECDTVPTADLSFRVTSMEVR